MPRSDPARWLGLATLIALIIALLPSPVVPARAGGSDFPDPDRGLALVGDGAVDVEAVNAADPAPTDDAPIAQRQPARKLPPHHKPGRRAASYNPYMRDPAALTRARQQGYRGPKAPPIEVMLADGTLPDPLAGNDTLIPSQQIALMTDANNGQANGLLTEFLNPTLVMTGTGTFASWGGQNSTWPDALGATAADVNADGRDELVSVANRPQSGAPCLGLEVATLTLQQDQFPCETQVSTIAGPLAAQVTQVTGGNYYVGAANGQGKQVAMVWNASIGGVGPGGGAADSICVRVWDNAAGSTSLTQQGINCSGGLVQVNTSMVAQPAPFAAASGDLNGDGFDEIVVAYATPLTSTYGNDTLNVTVYSVGSTGQVAATATITVTPPANANNPNPQSVAVAVGNFDNSGHDTIAVATEAPGGVFLYTFAASLDLSTLTQGNGGAPTTVAASSTGATTPAFGNVALVAAPFGPPPSASDQLAVIWQPITAGNGGWSYANQLAVYGFLPGLVPSSLATYATSTASPATSATNASLLSVSAAALYQGPSGQGNFTIPLLAIGSGCVGCSGAVAPSVTTYAITVPPPGSGTTTVAQVGSYTLSPSTGLTLRATPVGIVAGDFSGLSYRVQLLTIQPLPQTIQVEAVIQAPPTHKDEFPEIGATDAIKLNINFPDTSPTSGCTNFYYADVCARVAYVDQSSNQTTQTVGFQRSWGISATAEVNFSIIYGPQGFVTYLAVIFPDVILPCGASCTASSQQYASAGDLLPWYVYQTEPGNALSYPAVSPTDVLSTFVSLQSIPTVGVGQAYQFWINTQQQGITVTQTTTDISAQAEVSYGFKLFGQGVKLSTQGSYSQSSLSGQNTTYTTSSSIFYNYAGLGSTNAVRSHPEYGLYSQWGYFVAPLPYISTGTFVRSNYTTAFNTAQSQFTWQTFYNQPDLTFILPNRYSGAGTQATNDIQFTQPATPTVGVPVTIQATVRNFSVTQFPAPTAPPTQTLQVAFYNGQPNNGGTLIGTQVVPTTLPAQSATTVQQTFTPSVSGCFPIYAVIDPNNQIQEVHKANNTGYAVLAVFDAAGGGDNPCNQGAALPAQTPVLPAGAAAARQTSTGGPRDGRSISGLRHGVTGVYRLPGQQPDLAIAPSDIRVTALGAGQVGLSADVHAIGGHYSNVAVTFYDGDPTQRGRYIGHEVLPLVWSGHRSTASVTWDTAGLAGSHEVYARVQFYPTTEASRANNLAKVTVPLQPTTPTPVVPEWSTAWLFASGLLALGWLNRRAHRRRR